MWYNKSKGALLARADEPELSVVGEPKDVRSLYKTFGDAKLVDKLANVRGDQVLVRFDLLFFVLSNSITKLSHTNLPQTFDLGDNRTYALGYQNSKVEFLRLRNNQELNAIYEGMQSLTTPEAQDAQSQWHQVMKETIESAVGIATHLDKGASVLLNHHMLNDTDFVISSITQLLLDGYYRYVRPIFDTKAKNIFS